MNPQSLIIGAALLMLLVFVSGFMLSRKGAPYSAGVLTGHKVVSIAVAVLVVLLVLNGGPFDGVMRAAIMAAGIFFAVSVATGGMQSGNKEWPPAIATLHKLAPWFTLVSVLAIAYMMAL